MDSVPASCASESALLLCQDRKISLQMTMSPPNNNQKKKMSRRTWLNLNILTCDDAGISKHSPAVKYPSCSSNLAFSFQWGG